MARTKKNTDTGSSTITPNQLMQKFLKDNEKDHYNFEQEHDYVVSSGSLILDYELGGGFGPGLHRFVGFTESGKTSEALQIMKNFLKTVPNGRGFYIKACLLYTSPSPRDS